MVITHVETAMKIENVIHLWDSKILNKSAVQRNHNICGERIT